MKKVLYAVAAILVLSVLGLLIAPNFVDWNRYKGELSRLIKNTTGREVVFGGDVRARFLPQPTLRVDNVSLGNAEGASAPQMISLRSLVLKVDLGALIGGRLQVETLRLVEPVINVERMADGTFNFQSLAGTGTTTADEAAGTGGASDREQDGAGELPVQVDTFAIDNGTVLYRDHVTGAIERVDALNARLKAASLSGPFDADGSLVYKAVPLDLELSVGRAVHGRSVTFAANATVTGTGAKAKASGTFVLTDDGPTIKGKIKAEGESAAKLLGAFVAPGTQVPGALAQGFELNAGVQSTHEKVEIRELAVRLGEALADGAFTVTLGEALDVKGRLQAKTLDVTALQAMAPATTERPPLPEVAATPVTELEKPGDRTKASAKLEPPTPPQAEAADQAKKPAPTLPPGISANLELAVDAVPVKEGAVRQLKASIALTGGEITVNQVSALMPGGSELAAFGFVALDPEPRFEGDVEMRIGDLRGVMRWLDIPDPGADPDHLRKATVRAKVTAVPESITVANLDGELDASRIGGGVTVALRERPAFGADVRIDRLNLDSYLPDDQGRGPGRAPAGEGGESAGAAKPGQGGAAAPLAAFKPLADFDANLKMQVGALTYRGVPMADIALDATLFKGELTLRQATVGNLAGASFGAGGVLEDLGGVPKARGLEVRLDSSDPQRLFDLVGVQPAVPPAGLGVVKATVNADGALINPTVALSVAAAGGEASAKGTLSPFDLLTGLDLAVSARHEDSAALLRRLGIAYRPAGPVGGFDLTANVNATAERIIVSDLAGQLAGAPIGGTVRVDTAGAKPRVAAELAADALLIDAFLPRDENAGSAPATRGAQRGGRPQAPTPPRTAPADPSEHWSDEPLDLAGLKAFDAAVSLKAKALSYGPYRLDNAELAAELADGILTLSNLGGSLFGGTFNANGRLTAGEQAEVTAALGLTQASVRSATVAVAGKELAEGALDFQADFNTRGGSVLALVSRLAGSGEVALNRLNLKAERASGTALAGLLNLVGAVNTLGGALGGSRSGLADAAATFKAQQGIVQSDDVRFSSNFGSGTGSVTADLPRWWLTGDGSLTVSENLLGQILTRKANAPQTVPFTIRGPLDSPNVKLETGAMPGGGVRLPEFRGSGAVEGVLNRLLPGAVAPSQPAQPTPDVPQDQPLDVPAEQPPASGTAPAPAPPAPADEPATEPAVEEPPIEQPALEPQSGPAPQEQRRIRPEDLIRGILGGGR